MVKMNEIQKNYFRTRLSVADKKYMTFKYGETRLNELKTKYRGLSLEELKEAYVEAKKEVDKGQVTYGDLYFETENERCQDWDLWSSAYDYLWNILWRIDRDYILLEQ